MLEIVCDICTSTSSVVFCVLCSGNKFAITFFFFVDVIGKNAPVVVDFVVLSQFFLFN